MTPPARCIISAVSLGAAVAVGDVHATPYSIDPVSWIALSGSAVGSGSISGGEARDRVSGLGLDLGSAAAAGTAALREQGPGSLRAGVAGQLEATLAGTSLTFTGGRLVVGNSGTWQPAGVPSNLGGRADPAIAVTSATGLLGIAAGFADFALAALTPEFKVAVRSVAGELSGTALVSGAAGSQTFGTSGLGAVFADGVVEVGIGLLCGGPCPVVAYPLAAKVAALPDGLGRLESDGLTETLHIPLDFVLEFAGVTTGLMPLAGSFQTFDYSATGLAAGDVSLRIAGEIVASRSLVAQVPEPATPALLAGGLWLLALFARRRRAA